jgi:pimeloyl-ACP methyl ester carboxylesterase
MNSSRKGIRCPAVAGVLAVITACATQPPLQLAGVSCESPPPEHCPDASCPGPMLVSQGAAIEAKTGRKFFLDYPCDLKRGEKVTVILSLHGGGSYGNWQRHYFPIMDFKEKYRLVIATPNAPARVWTEADDDYLRNIVELIYEQVGERNVKAFWLVGHSQGGMTSNRLLRTDFFKERVTGWLSLSGGRLGPTPPIPASFFAAVAPPGAAASATPADAQSLGARLAAAFPGVRMPAFPIGLPEGDFSFIFETGEHELGGQPIPDASPWAERLGCGARVRRADVVDTRGGYVYDPTRQSPGSEAWGRLPRPGTAQFLEYPNCKTGRVVADVVRLGKGHTEGLEPQVTEQLIRMMLSARPPAP